MCHVLIYNVSQFYSSYVKALYHNAYGLKNTHTYLALKEFSEKFMGEWRLSSLLPQQRRHMKDFVKNLWYKSQLIQMGDAGRPVYVIQYRDAVAFFSPWMPVCENAGIAPVSLKTPLIKIRVRKTTSITQESLVKSIKQHEHLFSSKL